MLEKYLWSTSTYSKVTDSRSAITVKISTDIFQGFCGKKKSRSDISSITNFQEHFVTAVHLRNKGNT